MIPVRINDQWTLRLPPHRAAQWENDWERERLESMWGTLAPPFGEVVYYIGAEEGDMPALLSSWGCDTVLIEPGPAVWANIREIYIRNDLKDPLAFFVGFAGNEDRYDMEGFDISWPGEAYGRVTDGHGFSNLHERPDIPVVRVDSLCSSDYKVPPPTAISIDVEGAELEVLRGAGNTLKRWRPLVWVSIHPQFMADMWDQHPDEIFSLMAHCGYKGKMLADAHEQHWFFWPEEYGRV